MFSNSPEDAAAQWILESGIQNTSADVRTGGGFNGWLDVSTNSYPFIYSEITGYGMSSLVYMGKIYKSDIFLDRAAKAARWTIDNAVTREGGVLTKYYYDTKTADDRYRFEKQNVFAFDAGMVLYGLCNVALKTNDSGVTKSCLKIADFLVSKMLRKNGEFHAVWNLGKNEPFNDERKWSTRAGSYHAKIALPMIAMEKLTGDKEYGKVAQRVCEASLKFQHPDGRFVTHGKDTHLHPHCYSAEGLLYTGIKMDRPDFVEAAKNAANWAVSSQKESGGIPFLFENGCFVRHERTDILAQVLRLSSVFGQMKKLSVGRESIERLRNRLVEFQVKEGVQAGGIKFGFDFDGTMKSHLNSWCTMFSMQALKINKQYQLGEKIDLEIIV